MIANLLGLLWFATIGSTFYAHFHLRRGATALDGVPRNPALVAFGRMLGDAAITLVAMILVYWLLPTVVAHLLTGLTFGAYLLHNIGQGRLGKATYDAVLLRMALDAEQYRLGQGRDRDG